MATGNTINGIGQRIKEIFVILCWLPNYKKSDLSFDLIAGLTLASFILPESMAYARLAGVPPEFGIYSIIAGGIFFALFTSTKQLAIGPTSAMSLMVGSTIAILSGGDLSRWAAIASLVALAIFILATLSYILRLSSLVSFISSNILLGFKAGAAISIISTQLPEIFGLHFSAHSIFERLAFIAEHISESQIQVILFASVTLVLLILGNKVFPGRPVSLALVVVSILLMNYTSLGDMGFDELGELPAGHPKFGRVSLRFRDVDGIFGLALGCFLMGYIETVAVAKTFSQKPGETVNPRQELLSLAFANLGSSLTSGFPVAGGMSQTTVNAKAGARTPLSLVICSIVLMILLMYFTKVLTHLPKVILAVIVVHAVLGLIKIKALKRLYHLNRYEFAVALLTIAGVVIFGILNGVLIAAFISILLVLIRSKMPNVAVLGKIPDTEMYSDIQRHPENEEIKGIKIMRVEASILYYNEEEVKDLMLNRVDKAAAPIHLVIIDLSSCPHLDVAGAEMLVSFCNAMKARDIDVKIVEALAVVRDVLRKLGITEVTGPITRIDSVHTEVQNFLSNPKVN